MRGQNQKTDFGIPWTINLDICSFFQGGLASQNFEKIFFFEKELSILWRLTVGT